MRIFSFGYYNRLYYYNRPCGRDATKLDQYCLPIRPLLHIGYLLFGTLVIYLIKNVSFNQTNFWITMNEMSTVEKKIHSLKLINFSYFNL